MERPSVNVLWWLLLLAMVPVPAVARNGSVAIAVPVERITIDRDFSDWPKDMRRYPFALSERLEELVLVKDGGRPAKSRDG